jgi:hypothetical protein
MAAPFENRSIVVIVSNVEGRRLIFGQVGRGDHPVFVWVFPRAPDRRTLEIGLASLRPVIDVHQSG